MSSYVQLAAGNETKLAMLDIDETALSNWPVIRGDDFAFIKKGDCGDLSREEFCGWVSWDKPIDPTLELFHAAKVRGVTVFFITGRYAIGTARATNKSDSRRVCGLGGQGIDHAPRRLRQQFRSCELSGGRYSCGLTCG